MLYLNGKGRSDYVLKNLFVTFSVILQQQLETNRQTLTDLFMQLMEERDRREKELAKRLVKHV